MFADIFHTEGNCPCLGLHALHESPNDSGVRALTDAEVTSALQQHLTPPGVARGCMSGVRISVKGQRLQVESESCKVLASVRLLAAELGQAIDGATGDLLLILRCHGLQDIIGRNSWLFIVRDRQQASALRALGVLGFHGAIRTDFAESFRIADDAPLGEGLTAEVWRASERSSDEDRSDGIESRVQGHQMAVKIYKKSGDLAELSIASMPGGLEREVDLLAAVQGHPNIIRFRGLFCLEGDEIPAKGSEVVVPAPRWCLATEFCGGGDLFHTLRKRTLREPDAKKIMAGVLGALAHIHAHGILHRDVKAENVMLKDDGSPVLADFGLSCRISDTEAVMASCGSPGYIPPEVVLKQGWEETSDVFSAGVMLYFMLTGCRPFQGHDVMTTLKKTVQCRLSSSQNKCLDNASPMCKALVRLLLSKYPECRPLAEDALQEPWFQGNAQFDCRPSRRDPRASSAPSAGLVTPMTADDTSSPAPVPAWPSAPCHEATPTDDDQQCECAANDDEVRGSSKGSSQASSSLLFGPRASWKRAKELSVRMTPSSIKAQLPAKLNVIGKLRSPLKVKGLLSGGVKTSSVAPQPQAEPTQRPGPSAFLGWSAAGRAPWRSTSCASAELSAFSAITPRPACSPFCASSTDDFDIDHAIRDADPGEQKDGSGQMATSIWDRKGETPQNKA